MKKDILQKYLDFLKAVEMSNRCERKIFTSYSTWKNPEKWKNTKKALIILYSLKILALSSRQKRCHYLSMCHYCVCVTIWITKSFTYPKVSLFGVSLLWNHTVVIHKTINLKFQIFKTLILSDSSKLFN